MAKQPKKNKGNNFLVQGSILAIAGIVVRLIGLLYRVPLMNTIGEDGMGVYSTAFSIYNILLLISSYSLPLAVSRLVAARISLGQYKNARRVFQGALMFATASGVIMCSITWFGSNFFADLMKMPDPRAGSLHPDYGISWRVPWLFPGAWNHGSNSNLPDRGAGL